MLFVVALIIFVLDRLSKLAIQHSLGVGDHVPVLGDVLWLDHVQNAGIAFSLARSHGGLVFVFDVLAICFILYLTRRVPAAEPWLRVGLGMVLGGAIGNALDRVLAGSVTDFIDLRVWPVFNVADMGIDIGAVIIGWRLFAGSRTPTADAADEPTGGS
ncbi:MAG: signal peptidase II [Candidatus Dormibacteria bacterium]